MLETTLLFFCHLSEVLKKVLLQTFRMFFLKKTPKNLQNNRIIVTFA